MITSLLMSVLMQVPAMPNARPQGPVQTAPAPQAWVVVISGLSGEAKYKQRFLEWGGEIHDAVRNKGGVAADHVRWLAEDPSLDPERIDGRSDREGIEQAFLDLAGSAGPQDNVMVVLIGHANDIGGAPRINLPGPDMTAADFAVLLDSVQAGRVAFVNTASASGSFLPAVAAPGRIVITSTRSGMERNESLFGGFLAEALAAEAADQDKDGRISLLEAFRYARAETARTYDRAGTLLSEHALLEDDGDGEGTLEPVGEGGDGTLARGFFLDLEAHTAAAAADPRLIPLYAERDSTQGAIDRLRAMRESMDEEVYLAELEQLLLKLAAVTTKIRAIEGGGR